jgi:hypothetical protein
MRSIEIPKQSPVKEYLLNSRRLLRLRLATTCFLVLILVASQT